MRLGPRKGFLSCQLLLEYVRLSIWACECRLALAILRILDDNDSEVQVLSQLFEGEYIRGTALAGFGTTTEADTALNLALTLGECIGDPSTQ